MRIRGMGDKAQKAHIRAIKDFAGFLKRSPDTATPDDLRAYQLHMADTEVTPPGVQCPDHGTAVPVWYDLRARGDEAVHAIPHATPQTTDGSEYRRGVREFWRQPLGLASSIVPRSKHFLWRRIMRASEVCSLKVSDIDSDRMLIHVDQGKGGKDRKVMLSPDLLDFLRNYWREAQPAGWLFPGKPKINPISARQLSRAFNSAKHLVGTSKPATLHTLRHSFATHLLEANIDVLGHSSSAGSRPT